MAIARSAELLGVGDQYTLTFGHLAPTKEGISAEVPHVWVVYKDTWILDATLNDAMPTEELYNFKAQLRCEVWGARRGESQWWRCGCCVQSCVLIGREGGGV